MLIINYIAGRPVKNLEPHKEALVGLFRAGTTYEDLKEWLLDQSMTVSVRTIKSTFKKWEVGRRLRTDVEEAVKLKIQYYFSKELADDSTILQNLERDGYFVGKWTLVRLRLELGLKRRIQGVEVQARADALVHEATQGQLQKEIEKELTLNKMKDSTHERMSREPLCKARRGGISETSSPQQEHSPHKRCLLGHAWRDENAEYSDSSSGTAFFLGNEVEKYNFSQLHENAVSN